MTDRLPEYLHLHDALRAFVSATRTQDQAHIRPLHKYFALRLVVEGGFHPDDVFPRPPVNAAKRKGAWILDIDFDREQSGEPQVIGGLKSKKVDVAVCKPTIGPVVAISIKGTGNAFRNLTNRMEEAVGDCTNLHLRYPSLVYGFFHALKANREGPEVDRNDVSVQADGTVAPSISRYANALEALAGRSLWREDPSSYECVALLMVDSRDAPSSPIFEVTFGDGRLSHHGFVEKLLRIYDVRYPYMAEGVPSTWRLEWGSASPLFQTISEAASTSVDKALGYAPRLA